MLPWSLQARDPLAGQFSIYRDEYGVPHIVGETEEATFFGYGYAQAQDHLEKMFIQYRDAQGRRAEVQILRFAQDDSGGGHNIHSLVRTWR
jgi:acyl-homoserine lactone acylase PvdQ